MFCNISFWKIDLTIVKIDSDSGNFIEIVFEFSILLYVYRVTDKMNSTKSLQDWVFSKKYSHENIL